MQETISGAPRGHREREGQCEGSYGGHLLQTQAKEQGKEVEQESGTWRVGVELPGWRGKSRVGARWAWGMSGLHRELDSPPDDP